MSKFSFLDSWKHPVATALAVAAVSYFGSISTALAGKPGPDFLYAPYFHLRNLVSRMARLNAPARRGYPGLFLSKRVMMKDAISLTNYQSVQGYLCSWGNNTWP